MKTLSQLEEHVRKGAKQIANATLPGVIALDLSLARNRQNVPIVSQIQSQLYVPMAQLADQQFFDKHHEQISRWVSGKRVLAVLVFDFRLRLRSTEKWGLDGMMTWFQTTHDDEQANRDYGAFYGGFLKGVPNVTDLGSQV